MIKKYNRIKKKDKYTKGFWCHNCDLAFVREGKRCPICNSFVGEKRYKYNKKHVRFEDFEEM